ncbi:MAG: hypothetical protein NTX65_07250 [Ignavibacteriales bacterium]|nr:hypothetical protein [Ignavibacteriales bacterium]
MKTKFSAVSILFFIPILFLNAQTQNNIDVIYNLIERSVAQADSLLGGKQAINLSVTTAAPLEILKPKVLQLFSNRGYLLTASGAESAIPVNYTITSATVEYNNSFTNGFFGNIGLERKLTLKGSFNVVESGQIIKPVEFTESVTDTVKLDEISNLENKSIPFTQGQIPSEPLLSTFWEPIIVVGTLIVTVILLFTVRSK